LKCRHSLQTIGFIKSHQAFLSFSQQGEDLEIERQLGNKFCGFYVDIGAFHPIKYSNTCLFYRKGWHGINIEANPDSFQAFKTIRKRDINLNLAVSDNREELTYYQFNDPAINTFSLENATRWTQGGNFRITHQRPVKPVPLSEVLNRYLPDNQKIDFMSVDVEGMDLKVLKSNDWSRFRPSLLLVEENICAKKDLNTSEIYQFMSAQSYELVSVCGITMLFKDQKP